MGAAAGAAIAGAAAGGALSTGLNLAFGDTNGSALSQSLLAQLRGGIDAGGLRSRLTNGNTVVQITSSAERDALVAELAALFRSGAAELGELRGLVRPGYGKLSRVREKGLKQVLGALSQGRKRSLSNIRSAQRQAVGDLRAQLGRRRVLGSNFGLGQEQAIRDRFGRAQADVEAEHALYKAQAKADLTEKRATAFLQELGLNVGLLKEQQAMAAGEFETKLNELNLEANLARDILTSSNSGVATLSNTAAQLQSAWLNNIMASITSAATLGGYAAGPAIYGSMTAGSGPGAYTNSGDLRSYNTPGGTRVPTLR